MRPLRQLLPKALNVKVNLANGETFIGAKEAVIKQTAPEPD
jgi:hypothetical protein